MQSNQIYKLITEELYDIYTYNKKDQQAVIDRVASAAENLIARNYQPKEPKKPINIKTYTAKDFSAKRFPVPGEAYIFLYETCKKLPYEVNISGDSKCGYFKDEDSARIFARALNSNL